MQWNTFEVLTAQLQHPRRSDPLCQSYISDTIATTCQYFPAQFQKKGERFLYFQEEIFATHSAFPAAQTKELFTDI